MKQASYITRFISNFATHRLARGGAVVYSGTMLVNLWAYLYHLIVGRILGPEQYGEFAALLSVFYIFNVPSVVLQNILTKFFSILKAQSKLGQARKLLSIVTRKIVLFEALGFLLVLPFIQAFARFLNIAEPTYFVWLYLIVATFLLLTINISALQGFQLFTLFTVYMNIAALVRLVSGAIFAFFGVGWTLLGNALANAVGYALSFFPLRFLLSAPAKNVTLSRRSVTNYSVPAMLTTLGITALYSQDVVLVKHFFSAYDAGLYSALSVLGKVIFFATAAVVFVVFPVIAERHELGKKHVHITLYAALFVGVVSVALTVLYALFPIFIVRMLFGHAYTAAAPLLALFGIFLSLFSLSNLLANACLAVGKTFVWVLTVGSAVVQTVLIVTHHADLAVIIRMSASVTAALLLMLTLSYFAYEKH